MTDDAWLDLYWLPVGAGGHCVRWNGRVYERLVALHERRPTQDLYHSAMQLHLDGATYTVEMGPVWNVDSPERGVVCRGSVGAAWLGRFRAFQYEVRCWPDGCIPDIRESVDSPQRLSNDPAVVARVFAVLHEVPPLTWGRDELGTGEMWNSNSLVSWALARGEQDFALVRRPAGGRAPGWQAGLILAQRQGRLEAPARLAASEVVQTI